MKKETVAVSIVCLLLAVCIVTCFKAVKPKITEEQRCQHDRAVKELMTAEKGDLVLFNNDDIEIIARTAISEEGGGASFIFLKGKRASTLGQDGFIIDGFAWRVKEVIKRNSNSISYCELLKKFAVQ